MSSCADKIRVPKKQILLGMSEWRLRYNNKTFESVFASSFKRVEQMSVI